MKILLLTPLFPPDTGDPAPYVKELTARMAAQEVTVLMYGYLPEIVPGATLITIDKRRWLLRRLISYTTTLLTVSRQAELVVVNNAPSTELPALILSLVRPIKLILMESDPLALKASNAGFYKIIHTLLKRRCVKVISLPDETVYRKPEVLPFQHIDQNVLTGRETWWTAHLKEITTV